MCLKKRNKTHCPSISFFDLRTKSLILGGQNIELIFTALLYKLITIIFSSHGQIAYQSMCSKFIMYLSANHYCVIPKYKIGFDQMVE